MSAAVGVDYGRRRIGLAQCDPLGITTRGLETVAGGPAPDAAALRVARALEGVEAETIVVGLPLHDSGEESAMSAEVRRFAAALEEACGRPVVLYDEGLTSWEAEEALRARGVSLREARRDGRVDQEAARRLLVAWLRDGRPQDEPR